MMELENQYNIKYKVFIILQCVIWGIGNPITKFVYEEMTPFCYMTVRFLMSFLFFIAFFYKTIKEDLTWQKIRNCSFVGLFMAATYIFANLALMDSMVTIAGFLMGISVIFTSLISVAFFKAKLKHLFIVALVMVVVGMYMLCSGGTGNLSFGKGEFFALMSSLFLAFTLLASAKYLKDVSPFTLSTVQCAVTTIVCFIFGLIFEDFSCIFTKDIVAWGCLLYLAFGCTVAAFLLQNISIKHISPVFVSLALCTEPIFTAIASYFILGETITIVGIIGSILIMASVAIASLLNEEKE